MRQLIAILRGITPEQTQTVGGALINAGITQIEVPLNSPNAFESISRLATEFAEKAEIGAGTVLDTKEVQQVYAHGGKFIVSPNCYKAVIRKTKDLGMRSYPGVMTPTECFSALRWGADGLKLFPASLLGTDGVTAIRAVLPCDTQLYAVGGVSADNLATWSACGVNGFGVGAALFKPGKSVIDITSGAHAFVAAYDAMISN